LPLKELPGWFEDGLPGLFQIIFIDKNEGDFRKGKTQ
jgi:hypothetical protein